MADDSSYKNHARFLPPFHFFVIPVLLVNFLNEGAPRLARSDAPHRWQFVVAAALLTLGFLSRVQALTVQDRVIRLEERLRMRGFCRRSPAAIDDADARQLVALRFASDAELADMVREVVAGKLARRKDIKLRVRSWRARTGCGPDAYFLIARMIFGVSSQRRSPGPLGGSVARSMRQTAPFLNSIAWRDPIRRAASSPMAGSWPTSAIRVLRACFSRSATTAAKLPSGESESTVMSERPRADAGGGDLRCLLRSYERTGQHDVERDAEARQPAHRLAHSLTSRLRSAAASRRRATPRRAPRPPRVESDRFRSVRASVSLPAARQCAGAEEARAPRRSAIAQSVVAQPHYRACSRRQSSSSGPTSVSRSRQSRRSSAQARPAPGARARSASGDRACGRAAPDRASARSVGAGVVGCRFVGEFERVAQFLHRDAHACSRSGRYTAPASRSLDEPRRARRRHGRRSPSASSRRAVDEARFVVAQPVRRSRSSLRARRRISATGMCAREPLPRAVAILRDD